MDGEPRLFFFFFKDSGRKMNEHREISVVKTMEGKEAVRWKEKEMNYGVGLSSIILFFTSAHSVS